MQKLLHAGAGHLPVPTYAESVFFTQPHLTYAVSLL